ncbi:NAD binding Rossmann fold oxidoreductase like protein [Zymoseptoria brevis]|uniref:NAD binding Rossmann fold oxidoreductase like protein n=1 Tax=Zymoseptoria brevis TaxID=1047168 RepID=A0A0F4GM44_9PEZI|nr:NAD binding Rossmann fold oxidoreductase like protein [Zymoseptoria brevis]
MPPIKVGIIGYGSSAKVFHLPYILPNPDLEVHAFLQRAEAPTDKSNVDPGKHCTIDHPLVKHYRTPKDFFADQAIDLVVVCTAHDTHAHFAELALLSGKHVIVEKPFTITSSSASHLISLSHHHGKILTCFQNRRYDSDYLTLRSLLAQNLFGRITSFTNTYDVDDPPWIHSNQIPHSAKPGDGLLYGLGSHSIDQTLQIFGRPKSVTAVKRCLVTESGADDAFWVVLQYGAEREGLVVEVKTTAVAPVGVERMVKFEVRGTEGSYFKTGEDPQISHHFSGLQADDAKFGVEPESYHGYLSTIHDFNGRPPTHDSTKRFEGCVPSLKGSYMDYYRDVVSAIRGEKELVVKPEEARDVIRCIELANESAEKGVTVAWS